MFLFVRKIGQETFESCEVGRIFGFGEAVCFGCNGAKWRMSILRSIRKPKDRMSGREAVTGTWAAP